MIGEMKLIDRVHLNPGRINSQFHEEFACESRGIAQQRIEVSCSIEHKSFPLKSAAVAANHVVLLDEQHPQPRTGEQVGAQQSSHAGTDDDRVIRRKWLAAKRLESATHMCAVGSAFSDDRAAETGSCAT